MKPKIATDYGVRIVLYLLYTNKVCSSQEIADSMNIPHDYLMQLTQKLRGAEIIKATLGKDGGYTLMQSPESISVLDVMNAMGDEVSFPCEGAVSDENTTLFHALEESYEAIRRTMNTSLSQMSFGRLIDKIQAVDP